MNLYKLKLFSERWDFQTSLLRICRSYSKGPWTCGCIRSRYIFLSISAHRQPHGLGGLPTSIEPCGVCPASDLRGDRAGILIRAVMTVEILYYRPLLPHYSPLTFTAPRLESLYPPCKSYTPPPKRMQPQKHRICARTHAHVCPFNANLSLPLRIPFRTPLTPRSSVCPFLIRPHTAANRPHLSTSRP